MFVVNVDQDITQKECENPVPVIICNKNSDANQLLNAGCLTYILHKRCNDVNIPPSASVEVLFCSSLRSLPIDHMRECASVEAAINSDSKGKKPNNAITVLQKVSIKHGTKSGMKKSFLCLKIHEIDTSKKEKEDFAGLVAPIMTTRDRKTAEG